MNPSSARLAATDGLTTERTDCCIRAPALRVARPASPTSSAASCSGFMVNAESSMFTSSSRPPGPTTTVIAPFGDVARPVTGPLRPMCADNRAPDSRMARAARSTSPSR